MFVYFGVFSLSGCDETLSEWAIVIFSLTVHLTSHDSPSPPFFTVVEVKDYQYKWNQTGSNICCLNTDEDGLHDGYTWSTSKVSRSLGTCLEVGWGRGPSELSLPVDSRKPINSKRQLIIRRVGLGVIASQTDPAL